MFFGHQKLFHKFFIHQKLFHIHLGISQQYCPLGKSTSLCFFSLFLSTFYEALILPLPKAFGYCKVWYKFIVESIPSQNVIKRNIFLLLSQKKYPSKTLIKTQFIKSLMKCIFCFEVEVIQKVIIQNSVTSSGPKICTF